MKWGFVTRFLMLAVPALAALLLVGCATTKPIDWNSRVGSYTYDQAVTELGPPDRQAKLSNGETVAEWITRRNGGSSFSVGTGFFGGNTGFGVGQTVGTGYPDRILQLTFATNNVLRAWTKNY